MRRGPISYSAEEMAWLEANRLMVISDYHRAFVAAFSRVDVEAVNLHQLRKRKGWKVGREGGRYVGRLRAFGAAEISWLRDHCTMPIAEYYRAFQVAFDRPDVTAAKLHALRKRQGWKTGRTGQFEKGGVSFNKGKKCEPGKGGLHPNTRATQFKKGQKPHNAQDLGHERITVDGYVEISVAETNPYTGHDRRYVHKHRHLWEQANGPVPEGMALKCLDDDKTNTDPSNWEAIPRAVLALLNGGHHRKTLAYNDASPELKPTVMAVAKLKHASRLARKGRA